MFQRAVRCAGGFFLAAGCLMRGKEQERNRDKENDTYASAQRRLQTTAFFLSEVLLMRPFKIIAGEHDKSPTAVTPTIFSGRKGL